MNKMIPWWTPQICGEEYARVKDVLDSNYLNDGDVNTLFERRIAELTGARHAVAVTSGTAALYLSLKAVDIGPGDEVIVPDVTFIATANAVAMSGAKPVLVDIDPRTLNIDPGAMERAIGSRTKAVIPVHVSGRACDMAAVLKIANDRGIHVVEDAAEGFMSRSNGKYLGTFGIAGCLSFSPNKTITTGQGGIILTDDDRLHGRLRELKDQGRPVRGTGGDDNHNSVGYNFKLTNLQAAVGLGQLSSLDSRLERLRQIYAEYKHGLEGVEGISLPGFRTAEGESPQWVDALVERRDKLDRYLSDRNAHCRRFWFPLHTQTPYRMDADKFPNSSRVIPHALWLPSAFTTTETDIATVCGYIREFAAS